MQRQLGAAAIGGRSRGDAVTDVVSRVAEGTGPTTVSFPRAIRQLHHLHPVPDDGELGAQWAAAGIDQVAAQALEYGLRNVHILARRDLEDPEAGESALVAHQLATAWAKAGLGVSLITSPVAGLDAVTVRQGYRVVRKSGPYAMSARSALRGFSRRGNKPDGLVEIWDGIPLFSPIWARCPRVVVVHHVHAEMWRTGRAPRKMRLGEAIDLRLAPHVYRHSHIVTSSASSRDDLVALLGLDPRRIDVVPYGVDEGFSPGGSRSPRPLVVAVGECLPLKRFDALVDALVDVRRFVPDLHAEIVGDGCERGRIEAKIAEAGAADWILLRPQVSEAELVDVYRRGWVVASTATGGALNMSIGDAGACGTPAVATDTVGNRDSVRHEVSGLLAEPGPDFTAALVRVLTDRILRERLSRGALHRSNELTWAASATALLSALVEEARDEVVGQRSVPHTVK